MKSCVTSQAETKLYNMRRPEHEILLNDIRFSFLNKHSSQIRECFTFLQREIDKNHDDISLLFQNPQIIEMAYPKIVEYFTKKYNILSLIYNNKILYYYV